MGEVYLAEDLELGRQVALKVISSWADASLSERQRARERLRREAAAAATLTHPNICALFSFEESGGDPFLVMEYVKGETLAARLARGRLPLSQALRVAAQIAAGLGEAHRRGVVHRDVKPANVIPAQTGAKVLDFGLAKIEKPSLAADPSLTIPGAILGTPHYMSPEQVRGEEVDPRSDIFRSALCCTN